MSPFSIDTLLDLYHYLDFNSGRQHYCTLMITRMGFLSYSFPAFRLWGSALIIALITSDFAMVIEFTGAFSASFLGYILPAWCYLNLMGWHSCWQRIQTVFHQPLSSSSAASRFSWTRELIAAVAPFALLVFGIIAMIAGTVQALVQSR